MKMTKKKYNFYKKKRKFQELKSKQSAEQFNLSANQLHSSFYNRKKALKSHLKMNSDCSGGANISEMFNTI